MAPALAAVCSVVLLATCDLDKITGDASRGFNNPTISFSIAGGDQVILAGTTALTVTPALPGTAVRWSSSNPTIALVDSLTGTVSGVAIGQASITARVLRMELDTGLTQTKAMTVRYKGIRILAMDSITGLGHTRTVTVRGLNAQDQVQPTALTGSALVLSIHDSGSTAQTIATLTGGLVKGVRNGVAYVKAVYETNLTDSVKVKVRQVARRITFPDTVFTANAMNFNRQVGYTVRDVADSILPIGPAGHTHPRFRASDNTVIALDSMSGIFQVKKRDTTRLFVSVDTVTRSIKVRLIQQAGTLTRSGGDAQVDTVLRQLPVALRVVAHDSGSTPVPDATVTFRIGTGGGTLTDSVATTNANGEASLGTWRLGPTAGTQTVIVTSGAASQTFSATARTLPPRKLRFSAHPASAAIGTPITPDIKVEIRDSLDNLVTTATDSVTLTFGIKPNTAATLDGTVKVAAVAGVATFSSVSVSAGGAGYTLVANSGSLAGAVSNSFDIFGSAAKLAFVAQPVGSTAGGLMQPVQVAVQDANGAVVSTATDQVTLALGSAGSATLNGTRTISAVNGVATFSDLSVSLAGSGYTLVASAANRAGATSNSFTVSPVGTATRLAFSAQPSNSVAGQSIAPGIRVQVLDENGALVMSSTQQITLALENGAPLAGTFAVNASSGEATFSNVVVNRSGTGYRLIAVAPATTITSAVSNTFNVSPGPATRLGFIQQPTHTVSGQAISPAVTVAVQDAHLNTVATHPATAVTLTLGNCTGATLIGGGPVNTANGVATFPNLVLSATAASCSLNASAAGLGSGGSTSFASVEANGPVKLGFTTEPVASTTAGTAMNAGTVNIQASNGSNVSMSSSVQISISVLSGPGQINSGQTAYSTTSSASFTNITFNTAGRYRLIAAAPGFDPDTSAEFTITAGPANRLGFITQPHNIVAGVPFSSNVRVAVMDQFGNTVPGATNVIDLHANLTVSPFTGLRFNNRQFNISATAVDGVATFPGLSIHTAGASARIGANSGTIGGGSSTFNVVAAPLVALGFRTQPGCCTGAGQGLGSIEVQGQDSVGNLISTFGSAVTLTLTGGRTDAVLNGTRTITPTSGVATFSDLNIRQAASGYQLSASATGVSTAVTSQFTINPGPTARIAWIDQPVNTFANAPLNPSGQLPRIANQDQYGNTTGDCSGVNVTLVNPPAGMTLRHNGFNVTQAGFGQNPCSGITNITSALTISTHGTGIQLLATSHNTTLGNASSAPFNIAAFDAKTRLGFLQQPTNSTYGVDFSPSVRVAVQDQYGNTDTTATESVSLALTTNPSAAALSLTSVAPVKGVAAFSPLTLNRAAVGYVITASAAGLANVASGAFNVTLPGEVARHQNVCDMTRSGTVIYWFECSSAAALKSVSVFGGPITELAIGIPNPARIIADGTNVYWLEGGTSNGQGALKKMNIVTKAVTTMASGLFDLKSHGSTIGIDASSVYFAGRNQAGTTTAIRKVATGVAGPVTPTDIFEAQNSCTGCTVFFAVGTDVIVLMDPATDRIRRVSTAGGTPVNVSPTGQGSGNMQMVLNGSTLIYTQQANLKTLANATTTTTEVAPVEQIASGANFHAFALDGGFLYTNNNRTLRRYSVTDFAVSTTFGLTDVGDNRHILVDGTDVYVYNQPSSGHHIVKVPK